jgi:hypothetical protein
MLSPEFPSRGNREFSGAYQGNEPGEQGDLLTKVPANSSARSPALAPVQHRRRNAPMLVAATINLAGNDLQVPRQKERPAQTL